MTGETFVAENVPLAEGLNRLLAIAVDTLGHSAETPAVEVTRDSLPPEIAITEPLAGDAFDTTTVTVRGTVTDAHLDAVTVNGVAAAVSDESFEATVELPEGDSEITARAVDVLGQATNATPVAVTVDTLAPVVRLDPPADPLVATPTIEVTGTIREPHLDEITVAGQAAVVDGETFTVYDVPLAEGTNELTAVASDTFGHSTTSEPVTYVLDSTPPELTIDSPIDGTIVTSLAVEVTGAVSDAHLAAVTVNGVAAAIADGRYATTVAVADGANTLLAVASDELGHTTEASVTVFLDTLPPAVSIEEPALDPGSCLPGGQPVTLSGSFADPNPATGEDGQPPAVQVEVVPAGGAATSYVGTLSQDQRQWTVPGVDLGSADGIATATVIATDVIGNVSQVAGSWRIDAGAPQLTLTLDGAPFPGAAPGDTPPPGAQPVLFGRQIAAGATVVDGATGAPPDAVLTLDGVPYAAGTAITAEGDHSAGGAGHRLRGSHRQRPRAVSPRSHRTAAPCDAARRRRGPDQRRGHLQRHFRSRSRRGPGQRPGRRRQQRLVHPLALPVAGGREPRHHRAHRRRRPSQRLRAFLHRPLARADGGDRRKRPADRGEPALPAPGDAGDPGKRPGGRAGRDAQRRALHPRQRDRGHG